MSNNELSMGQHGTRKEIYIEAHVGLKEILGSIKVS